MIYIYKPPWLAKNQVSAVFHSRVICRSLSPKFIELCIYVCILRRGTNMAAVKYEQNHLSLSFALE